MQKIIFFTCLILMTSLLFGQPKAKEFFLQKSKSQKTTAWVLLSVGSAAIITGAIVNDANKQSYTGGFILVGGVICGSISIPFFVGSYKNKKRATTLTITNQRILLAPLNSFGLTTIPAISLKISI